MKYLTKKHYILMALLIVLFIIKGSYSLGFLLGTIAYWLNYKFIEFRYNHLLTDNKFSMVMLSFLGIILLSSSLFIALLLPKVFNWCFVFIAILVNKYYLIYKELRGVR